MRVVRDIELTFHSTPQLWAAKREGYCGCHGCQGKIPIGWGKTETAALANLIEISRALAAKQDRSTATRSLVKE